MRILKDNFIYDIDEVTDQIDDFRKFERWIDELMEGQVEIMEQDEDSTDSDLTIL